MRKTKDGERRIPQKNICIFGKRILKWKQNADMHWKRPNGKCKRVIYIECKCGQKKSYRIYKTIQSEQICIRDKFPTSIRV